MVFQTFDNTDSALKTVTDPVQHPDQKLCNFTEPNIHAALRHSS